MDAGSSRTARRISPTPKPDDGDRPSTTGALKIARYRTTTLGDLGARLPVGIPEGGRYERAFDIRDFHLKEEKEIGAFRAKAKGLTAGRLVSEVLSVMCTRIGPHDFERMKPSERLVSIARMQMMDVLYAYFFVRVSALGSDFPVSVSCPACRANFVVDTDLNDLDVKVIDYAGGEEDTLVDLTFEYPLDVPMKIGSREGSLLTIGPIEWSAMDCPEFEGINAYNPTIRDMVMLRSAIKKLDGESVVVTFADLDAMKVKTKLELIGAVQDAIPGPQLFVGVDCQKCARELMQPIEWSYDLFFALSSRSPSGSP